MGTLGHPTSMKINSLRTLVGIVLILAGGLLFLDRYLKTGWLSLLILPTIGLFLYLWGIKQRRNGMIIAGGLLGGIGAGMVAAWGPGIQLGAGPNIGFVISTRTLIFQIGALALFFAVGWGIVAMTTLAVTGKPTWWGLIPGGVFGGLGACLLFTPVHWTDVVLYLAVGTGLPLLIWGLVDRLFGLVIPGCLLITIGAGIYMAWPPVDIGNTLVRTGIMLIWFSSGWLLMTAAARVIMRKYVWWPLIPGATLAVAGMGLYIGGDPGSALGFIGNTGSIALMIFGLYLLLMRKSIHH